LGSLYSISGKDSIINSKNFGIKESGLRLILYIASHDSNRMLKAINQTLNLSLIYVP
jgi:hypothetical protein